MALSLMTDPFFDQFFGGGRSRGSNKDLLQMMAPTAGSFPALHINCDVVEHPDRYSIIAGECLWIGLHLSLLPSWVPRSFLKERLSYR